MRFVSLGVAVVTGLLVVHSAPAHAQFLEDFEETVWGVQTSFTPRWRSVGLVEDVFQIDALDITGSDFTFGFARGRMRSGHWGVSFLRQRWQEAHICGDGACAGSRGSAWLQGLNVNWFRPFGSPFAADRVQVGMHVDLGAAWYQGTVRIDEVLAGGSAWRVGEEVAVTDLLPEHWGNIPVPLVRVEAAVAVMAVRGLKIIGSGGWGFPFGRRFGMSVAWFPAATFNGGL